MFHFLQVHFKYSFSALALLAKKHFLLVSKLGQLQLDVYSVYCLFVIAILWHVVNARMERQTTTFIDTSYYEQVSSWNLILSSGLRGMAEVLVANYHPLSKAGIMQSFKLKLKTLLWQQKRWENMNLIRFIRYCYVSINLMRKS